MGGRFRFRIVVTSSIFFSFLAVWSLIIESILGICSLILIRDTDFPAGGGFFSSIKDRWGVDFPFRAMPNSAIISSAGFDHLPSIISRATFL